MKPDEALFQENQRLQTEIERLKDHIRELQRRRPIVVYTFRPCATPGCDTDALVHPQTPIDEVVYCVACANARRREE